MLCAAGLSQHDPVLASLFRVDRLCPHAMEQLYYIIDTDPAHGASYELLADIVSREKQVPPELSVLPSLPPRRREAIYLEKLQINKDTIFEPVPNGPASYGQQRIKLAGITADAGKMRIVVPLLAAH